MTILEKLEKLFAARPGLRSRVERQLGLPRGRFQKWAERGTEPSVSQANAIARALGEPVAWLLDDALDDRPPAGLSDDERGILALTRGMTAEEVQDVILLALRARQVGRSYPTIAEPPSSGFRHPGGPAPTPADRPRGRGADARRRPKSG